MNERKTLYISDLDGTLLNNSAEVSEYTTDTLNVMIENGLNFSVATARTLASSKKILSGLKFCIPIVLMNGVLIYDLKQEQYIRVNKLMPETVSSVINVLRDFEITGFMYELKNEEFMTYYESLEQKPLHDFVEERVTRYYKAFQHTDRFSSISSENIIYFTLIDIHEKLLPIYNAFSEISGLNQAFYKDSYSENLWFLEVFSIEASKKNAVNFLKNTYGYERIVGFGDNYNDLPMFEICDVRIAVSNAIPDVKTVADFICEANSNDGVVKWLEEKVRQRNE